MNANRIGFGGLLSIALALSSSAQTVPFQFVVTQGQNTVTVQNGGPISFAAAAGQSQTAQITATYTGSGQVTISQQPNVVGSTAFTAKIVGTLPLVVSSGTNFSIALVFSPTNTTQSNAQLSLPYVETVPPATTNANTISFSLQGTGPSFVLSYVFPTNQNVVSIQSGGSIPFPATLVGATAQASLTLTNTGSGPGSITGITSSGSAFLLQGIPMLPATVNAGQPLTVQIVYQPTSVGTSTGQVTITFASGAPVTVNLTGSATSPVFTYQLLGTNPPTTVSSGGTITLPSANVGQTTSVTIQVLNWGMPAAP